MIFFDIFLHIFESFCNFERVFCFDYIMVKLHLSGLELGLSLSLSRVRRSAGLSIPGWDTNCMSCSVFICALRSHYSALNFIPLYNV